MHALLTDERAIGRVVAARIAVGEYLPGWHPYEDYRTSYAARRDLGGGVILTLIHELDYAYWLFGAPRRLFAVGGHLSDLELDVEDTASILMDCGSDGARAPRARADGLSAAPADTDLRDRGLARPARRRSLGARRYARLRCGGRARRAPRRTDFERNTLFLDELTHFLACVRQASSPLVPLADGVATLRIALAARHAWTPAASPHSHDH